ncbi:MAG: 16S rRNA (guanine(527)-N(7))-methyltransferase RsmG [Syntrophorhabdaceae bacterium]|nr:16S rRNA (guanine(527)-N(7))-methyltransferase RsmG [Syntrophorhabdaceae bacterium]
MSGTEEIPAPDVGVLEEVLGEAGIGTCRDQVERLAAHAAEMLRWNRSIRLTAIVDPVEVAVKHIADSLALLKFAPFPGRLLDFGSGTGYPGIPLALYLPGTHVVLLESSAKKCAFLSRVRSMLRIENMVVVNAKARVGETLPIGKFDDIVTRATSPPAVVVPLLSSYLAEGGRMLFMEGPGDTGRERKIPGTVVRRERFSLPRGMGEREIVEVVP